MALVMSFSSTGLDVSEPLQFVGLANFERLITDPMVRRVLITTFLYLVGVVPPIVLSSLGLAVLVNQGLPGRDLLRAAFHTRAGVGRGGRHCFPLALCRERTDQWVVGGPFGRSIHADRFLTSRFWRFRP